MQTVNRNIVILPDVAITDKAIVLSEKANAQVQCDFLLDRQTHLPHITVHQFAIPEDKLPVLEELVQKTAIATYPFRIKVQPVFGLFNRTGLFWNVDKENADFYNLHKHLVSAVDRLREGYIPPQHLSFLTPEQSITSGQRRSLGRWGNMLVLEEWWPHITITSCTYPAEAEKLRSSMQPASFEMQVTEVHITELGPHGTCPGSLQNFPLAG